MQHYHIWMNIFLAVTSEMKTPNKAMAFHHALQDKVNCFDPFTNDLECKAGSGTPLNLMMQKTRKLR